MIEADNEAYKNGCSVQSSCFLENKLEVKNEIYLRFIKL